MFGWAANVRRKKKSLLKVRKEQRRGRCEHAAGEKHAGQMSEMGGPYRVHKEGFEILGLGTQLGRPGDLPFKDFVDRIHVVEVWTLGEEQLSPPGKKTLEESVCVRRAANQWGAVSLSREQCFQQTEG